MKASDVTDTIDPALLASGNTVTRVSTLHRDALGSVRAVTTAAGLKAERAVYRPYGEEQAQTFDLATLPETKGFIGERYDADAGLQFLNARYYDPTLGLFLQPDWWEVTQGGVGTNRYGYAGGDAVNASDPGGNGFDHERPDPGPGQIGDRNFTDDDRRSIADQIQRHRNWVNVGSTWYNGARDIVGLIDRAFNQSSSGAGPYQLSQGAPDPWFPHRRKRTCGMANSTLTQLRCTKTPAS